MSAFDENEVIPLMRSRSSSIPAAVPDRREHYQRQRAVYLILASVLFERMAFYSLSVNLILYLESDKLQWTPKASVAALNIFYGTTYLSTLLFAILSDSKLTRATTIIIGYIIYLIGYILVAITAIETSHLCPSQTTNLLYSLSIFDHSCAPAIMGTLILTAIGAGAVRSNMAVFGAEQTQKSERTSRYFDKYMVAVNIGSIVAISALPYIKNQGATHYFIGHLVATSMLLLAILLFILGRRYYLHIKSHDTVIAMCMPVVSNACQSWCRYKKRQRTRSRVNTNTAPTNSIDAYDNSIERGLSISINEPPPTLLEFARVPYGRFPDRIVNDVKSFRGALIVFCLLIPYWLVYSQLHATFPLQGEQMDTSGNEHMITWMSLGDPVTIILGIVFLNMFVYEYWDTRNRARLITIKFIIGMIFACITMCLAGSIEIVRQHHCVNSTSPVSNSSSLSIYAQLPQNIGMGLSELFAMVASYEFAYVAAPRSAQSLLMSLRFCSLGISSLISMAYMYVFPTTSVELDFRCLSDEKWHWSFYTYFFILAALQALFIIILIVCQRKFQIIKVNPEKLERNSFS